MDARFASEMLEQFDEILDSNLFSKIGLAKDFPFDDILVALKIWSFVPNRKAAIFSLESRNWGRAVVGMLNDTNQGLRSNDDLLQVQKVMGDLVRNTRPELDARWAAFRERSGDSDLADNISLSADYMGLCRERYIERLGGRPRGSFGDLFAIYRAGFVPCGWDGGDFPDGELLIF